MKVLLSRGGGVGEEQGRISLWVAAIRAISLKQAGEAAGQETPTQCYRQALLRQTLVPPTYKGPGVNIGICAHFFRLLKASLPLQAIDCPTFSPAVHNGEISASLRYLFLRDDAILTS